MVPREHGDEAIVADGHGKEEEVGVMGVSSGGADGDEEQHGGGKFSVTSFLWHGGSVWDAWFSCASNQVAQVLLTLPYSFSQLGMLSGILLQLFYGFLGSWTAYLISVLYVEYRSRKEKEGVSFKNHVIQWFEVLDGLLGPYWKAAGLAFNCTFLLFGTVIQLIACASNIYYINDRLDKRTWTYIFGACCATTVFIPSFHNYRIWSFLGLGMTTYTAWYLAIAALINGQVEGVTHTGPNKLVLYFTGATNILYTFGGHAVTVEIMHAMWKPAKFKYIYLHAALLRVGEGDRHARHQERLPPRPRQAPHRRPHLVPRHHLPLLRPHQLRRRRPPRQLHRLHHPRARPHAHLPIRIRPRQRGGEAALLPAELDGDVRAQRLHRGVGVRGRLRARRLGQHGQLHPPDQHLRPLRQVLPVPQARRRRRPGPLLVAPLAPSPSPPGP
ncbi:unnamed protein product [Triticum turgidum subsp. durum]|uniref:Amino acid transporter transmembrane domain-containing protein n=1 Tax=Triticum turgidum subsp. durum TaxID=4567 RepID=A0A9R1QQV2_TRITD|nr:unnamed protein product [Triticum turgidum subsp. durum]